MHGIDLSNNNDLATVDWTDVEFAFVKITEGTNFVDPEAQGFINACVDRGIPWGGYHFAHADQHAAADEARFFLDHLLAGWEIAPALDFETYGSHNPLNTLGITKAAVWIDDFLHAVDGPTHPTRPFFYTFRSYAASLYGHINPEWLRWLATATGTPATPTYAGYEIAIEQWGIVGGLDQNESYLPILGDEMQPAHLVLLDDGEVIAFPSCGASPYLVVNPSVLDIGIALGFFDKDPRNGPPSDATESAAIRAAVNYAHGAAAGSPVTNPAPTHFTGTVDLRAGE